MKTGQQGVTKLTITIQIMHAMSHDEHNDRHEARSLSNLPQATQLVSPKVHGNVVATCSTVGADHRHAQIEAIQVQLGEWPGQKLCRPGSEGIAVISALDHAQTTHELKL